MQNGLLLSPCSKKLTVGAAGCGVMGAPAKDTVRESGRYIVNGQKTWITQGQPVCKLDFLLVRTAPEAKPQRDISFLLIDMRSPGVAVRPIIAMDGAHEVNEIWLDETMPRN